MLVLVIGNPSIDIALFLLYKKLQDQILLCSAYEPYSIGFRSENSYKIELDKIIYCAEHRSFC